ncbi:hypothetical protein, partial [Microbacterium terrae]|uniref:hypothetical protein n=1 Tax=Microbacterium terrae TaxID=69369 RepID=UPI001B80883E
MAVRGGRCRNEEDPAEAGVFLCAGSTAWAAQEQRAAQELRAAQVRPAAAVQRAVRGPPEAQEPRGPPWAQPEALPAERAARQAEESALQ